MTAPSDPPLLDTAAVRALEAQALAAHPPGALMARAADAVADAAARLLRTLPARTPVLALVGPGNNGGDALLAALRLAARGWVAAALAPLPGEPAADDARDAWARWRAAGRGFAAPETIGALLQARPLVIDGLFGIGLARPLPDAVASLVRMLDAADATVLAVDVPSGLDADTGRIVGPPGAVAVRAATTVTMIADKPGLHTGAGVLHAGRVVVAPLGVTVPPQAASGHLVDRGAAARRTVPRPADAHKGRFGDVLVVAGDPTMRGAAVLAALGAQAVGAGRIHLGLGDAGPLPGRPPDLMTRHLQPGATSPEDALGPATSLVIGCGLGGGEPAMTLLARALAHPAALVLDADGLNRLAEDPALRARLAARAAAGHVSVLTPHPLEAARLLGTDTATVQADRIATARSLAGATGAIVVLKGAGSVVADPGGRWSINGSGGPILAVAGTGDVLAGAIGGLLATGLAAREAALLGTWLHGAAGDALAAEPEGCASIGMPASQLPAAIRATLNRLAAGRCAT